MAQEKGVDIGKAKVKADIITAILGAEIAAPSAATTGETQTAANGATDTPTAPTGKAKSELNRVLRVTKPLIKGEDVKAVQAALIAKKYHCGIGGASGIYNADTAHAVRMFQAASRLIVSGQVDKFTAKKLGGVWTDTPADKTE